MRRDRLAGSENIQTDELDGKEDRFFKLVVRIKLG
jgi:hypothetical protein